MIDHPELGYEQSPLIQLRWATAAEEIVNRGIKWIHDGGALNPRGLYEETKKYLNSKGLLDKVKISWVEGDNVYDRVKANLSKKDGGEVYPHLDISGQTLNAAFNNEDVKKIVSANAYSESTQPDLGHSIHSFTVGMRGILAALQDGAQIIICGRVCDASPVMALGAWYAPHRLSIFILIYASRWHGWSLTDWDRLAGSLVAGHITECGPVSLSCPTSDCSLLNLIPSTQPAATFVTFALSSQIHHPNSTTSVTPSSNFHTMGRALSLCIPDPTAL